MITGRDFLIFSDDWGRHPFSCQHIMSRFLPANRLLWVNTIGMRNPRLTAYDIRRSLEKIRGWVRPKQEEEAQPVENLTVISPVMTPYNNIAPIRARNRRSVIRAVRGAMAKMGMRDPVLVTTLPNAADYIGAFNEAAVIYYCVDDFTKWPGVNQELVAEMEEQLLGKADSVCASADELCVKKTRGGVRPLLLPHGVDFDHFASAALPRHPDLPPGLSRPVIGFFGAISPWLDFDLIIDLARSRPEWSFVFIGPADVDVSRLAALSNIHLVGKVSYRELPAYAASFDAALIPFQVNDLTISVNPLKLMEYLACGLPVISTRLPEVEKYAGAVYLADTAGEFGDAISRALAENSPELRERRRETARALSWGAVAETFSREIERVVTGRGDQPVEE